MANEAGAHPLEPRAPFETSAGPTREVSLTRFAGVGEVLANRYHIDRMLGSGGMGVVVAARSSHSRREVAIKFPLPNVSQDENLLKWFHHEIRAARRIESSHVVRILDVDVRHDGVPYFVMDLLEGETLASYVRTRGRLSVTDAVDYLIEVSAAVAAAHAVGIVHRDLKPTNVFLSRGAEYEHTVKLLDFGISKSFPDEPSTRACSDALLGSPPYMSPEQLAAPASVDHRTDIWGLGAVLYECLTGTSPFLPGEAERLFVRILQEPAAPIAAFRRDVPDLLERIVRRCLTKAKHQRFATVAELARALAPLASERARRPLRSIDANCRHARIPDAIGCESLAAARAIPVGTDTEPFLNSAPTTRSRLSRVSRPSCSV